LSTQNRKKLLIQSILFIEAVLNPYVMQTDLFSLFLLEFEF